MFFVASTLLSGDCSDSNGSSEIERARRGVAFVLANVPSDRV